jgi:hypothetical protein
MPADDIPIANDNERGRRNNTLARHKKRETLK